VVPHGAVGREPLAAVGTLGGTFFQVDYGHVALERVPSRERLPALLANKRPFSDAFSVEVQLVASFRLTKAPKEQQ
jgi:hypothetical protein